MKWTNGPAPAPLPPTARAYASASPELDFPAPMPPSSSQKIEARLPAADAVAPRAEAVREMPPVRSARIESEPEPRREAARDAGKDLGKDIARSGPTSGWVIQLAAATDESEARAILSDARSRSGRVLADAKAFTEKVVRGGSTLYRARFSGFDEPDSAQEACRSLKTRGFACFATRS
jgi:D-alanyl-D-alanine carboxypeptidase